MKMTWPKFKMVDPNDLFSYKESTYPDGYQRDPEEARVQRIVDDFDHSIFGVIHLAIRAQGEPDAGAQGEPDAGAQGEPDAGAQGEPDAGKMFVTDGWHRVCAAKERGLKSIPAVIVEGTTIKDEAKMFARQSENHKNISQFHKFQAHAVAERDEELGIATILSDHQLKVGPSATSALNQIGAISTLRTIYRRSPELLNDTLSLILTVWPKSKAGLEDKFLKGVSDFLYVYERELSWEDVLLSFKKAEDDGWTPAQIKEEAVKLAAKASAGSDKQTYKFISQQLKSIMNTREYGNRKIKTKHQRSAKAGAYTGMQAVETEEI